jgi:hypothetical protein
LRSRSKLRARLRKRPSERLNVVTLYLSNDGMRKIRIVAGAVDDCASYCFKLLFRHRNIGGRVQRA